MSPDQIVKSVDAEHGDKVWVQPSVTKCGQVRLEIETEDPATQGFVFLSSARTKRLARYLREVAKRAEELERGAT